MRKHLKLNTKLTKLSKDTLSNNLQHPDNLFPPKFFIEDKNSLAAGYFVSYQPKTNINELYNLCKKGAWNKIANINGEFIILFYNEEEKKLSVITDQTGKFPCYYSCSKDKFLISTSFYEVFKDLDKPTLNTRKALEFIYRDITTTQKTIIEEVSYIPPATLAEFKGNSCKLTPKFDVEKFINTPVEHFDTLEQFGNKFVKVLDELVSERASLLEKIKYGAEMSSGFDSTLVCYLLKKNSKKSFTCYSEIAKDATDDTNQEIVEAFIKKHSLKIKYFSYEEHFPFSTKEDLDWIRRGPSFIQKSQAYEFFKFLNNEGNRARFTGEGGDEAYWSNKKALDIRLQFVRQIQFFEYQSLKKYGIDKIFTKSAIERLLDKNAFKKRVCFPLAVSDSVVSLFINTFPLDWETGVWSVSPYADSRLIQVARGIPSKNIDNANLKQNIWKSRTDIFPKEQFVQKGGTREHYSRFLTEKKGFIISLLKNSLLADKDFVQISKIAEDIKKETVDKYKVDESMGYLLNLLELEYFLQKNNVKVD